jgi:hypothetical protein
VCYTRVRRQAVVPQRHAYKDIVTPIRSAPMHLALSLGASSDLPHALTPGHIQGPSPFQILVEICAG